MTESQIPSNAKDFVYQGRNSLFFPDENILRPTWDHAFKAIFLNHRELTLRFVNDFFEFESPIKDLSFLSTEIEPQGHDAKTVRLDVALKLANGTLIDLEMQTSLKAGYLRRCVLYNAVLLTSHTKKGASFNKKKPTSQTDGKSTDAQNKSVNEDSHSNPPKQQENFSESNIQPNVISLTLLNDDFHKNDKEKFRYSYQLKDGDDYLDKDCFRIDVIELPKLRRELEKLPARQRIWIRLFLAHTYAEVKQLAHEEPLFRQVCEVLEMVSKDRKMQDRARMIWEGEFAVRNERYLVRQQIQKEEREAAQKEFRQLAEELKIKAAEAEQQAIEKEQKAIEKERMALEAIKKADATLAAAVRSLASIGQTSEAIATQFNLTLERVTEILKSR